VSNPVEPLASLSPAPPSPESDALAVTGLHERPPGSVTARNAEPSEPAILSPGVWQADEGLESDLPVPEGELLGGRYLVERIFAEGGMGIVCFGRHMQLEQPVAIKFLRRALSGKPSVVERFMNEGRALAALRSEHVVRVMDVGQLESGRPYLVMEHLEGIDLDALVDRDGALSVETAISYVLQVCEPLAEAHALGIVHRDIKPENLFLWSGGPGKDIVKVLDFGLAKQFGSPRAMAVTGPQDSMGSPCYMSPEQIVTPQSIDSRTDIWSLGVVLYRLLTDSLPFDGGNVLEVLSHVLNAQPKSLLEARPGLDPALDAIVRRCLEKAPDARYATITDLSAALTGYLAERQAHTLPPAPASLAPASLAPASLAPASLAPTSLAPTSLAPTSLPVPKPIFAAPAARVFEGDDEKIRIPGVHSRWPGVLFVTLSLGAAAVYQADRTGRIRVRDLTDGKLTPALLSADVPPPAHADPHLPQTLVVRGVFAQEPTHAADGTLALRAVPEVDTDAGTDTDADTEAAAAPPISRAEQARRVTAYREYLRSQGLTPLREVLPTLEAPVSAE
jgi:serine/threonine protein kinase